jgi:hypothetical protein
VPWNDPNNEYNAQLWGRPISGIPFTQFLMPDGRRTPVWIDRPKEIEDLARDLIEAGAHFDIEMLRTRDISMTVEMDVLDDPVLASEICSNGPDVPVCVDRIVRKAHARVRVLR